MTTLLPAPRSRSRLGVDVAAVLGVCLVLGVVGGLLWTWVWDPPEGVVQGGNWLYTDFPTIERVFSATGLYVIIGVVGGLLVGLLAGFLCRSSELAVLGAVAVGSALAAYVAYRVGLALSPPNPHLLALVVDDETRLSGNLDVPGRSPFVAWPIGALVALAMSYLWWTAAEPLTGEERPAGL